MRIDKLTNQLQHALAEVLEQQPADPMAAIAERCRLRAASFAAERADSARQARQGATAATTHRLLARIVTS